MLARPPKKPRGSDFGVTGFNGSAKPPPAVLHHSESPILESNTSSSDISPTNVNLTSASRPELTSKHPSLHASDLGPATKTDGIKQNGNDLMSLMENNQWCSACSDLQPSRGLRVELENRFKLAELYDLELAAATSGTVRQAGGMADMLHREPERTDLVTKAMRNFECCLVLASQLGEYPALVRCATGLAELHIGRRDLPAASATFDACVAACCCIPHVPLRALLLQRVLPMSMEVLNMQGLTAESFARWLLLMQVLALSGRGVPLDCPICAQPFTQDRACLALGCGHSFHRDCCDAWLGQRMMVTGAFSAQCPVCNQVDPSLKPTPAAAQVLQSCGRLSDEGSTSANTSGGTTSSGSSRSGGSTISSGSSRSGGSTTSSGSSRSGGSTTSSGSSRSIGSGRSSGSSQSSGRGTNGRGGPPVSSSTIGNKGGNRNNNDDEYDEGNEESEGKSEFARSDSMSAAVEARDEEWAWSAESSASAPNIH